MIESLVSDEDFVFVPEGQDNDLIPGASLISMETTYVNGPWVLPLLLNNDVQGYKHRWQIGFDGEELVTCHGRVGGALQTVKRKVTINQSGRDVYQQSLIEGKKRYLDKCMQGYTREGDTSQIAFQPMLATEYTYTGKQLKDWTTIAYQPKIDGVRALISLQSTGIVKLSRSNRVYPFVNHIDEQCKILLSMLPSGTVLDGEMYKHGEDFNRISGIVRRTKERDPEEHIVEYWVFDIVIWGMSFEERYMLLYNAYLTVQDMLPSIRLVPVYTIDSLDNINTVRDMWINAGYEGLILRKTGPDSHYKPGRSNHIFKVKYFKDAEANVIDVISGEGTEEGLAIFILHDPELGVEFPVRPAGSFEQRRYWFQHPETVIGQPYTYKCMSRNIGEKPRHPVGKGFRNYE